jgi:hypothetical protein
MSFLSNGDILVVGSDDGDAFGSNDGLLMRISSDGDLIWKKVFGGFSNEHFHHGIELPGGNIVVAGSTQSYGPGPRAGYVVKTDANGNLIWAKTYGGLNIDFPHGMVMTDEYDFVIGGVTNSFGAGQYDLYLFQIDSSGTLQWTKTYGGGLDDWGVSVIHAPSNTGYIITGYTDSFGNGDRDIILVRTDREGNAVWSKTFGTGGFEAVDQWANTTLTVTQDGGLALTGWTDSLSIAGEDVLLVKSDGAGRGFCDHADIVTSSHEMITMDITTGESSTGTYSNFNMTVTNIAFVVTSHCYCTSECE